MKVLVQYLRKSPNLPREQWPVDSEETMAWEEYLDLPVGKMALTRCTILTDPKKG